MTPRLRTGRNALRLPRQAVRIVKRDDERARSFAAETHSPDNGDRTLLLGIARTKGLPFTPILQAWAELDHAAWEAA